MNASALTRTYIDRQVERINRNMIIVNGGLLTLLSLLALLMVLGAWTLGRSSARLQAWNAENSISGLSNQSGPVDMSNPIPIGMADIASPQRLESLAGQAVTLTDPKTMDTMFPVFGWMERATGANKPKMPPSYRISDANGSLLLIVPSGDRPGPKFTGVIRLMKDLDRNTVTPVLLGHGMQANQLQPFLLDCLAVGAKAPGQTHLPVVMHPVAGPSRSPVSLLAILTLIVLPIRNLYKAVQRIKNPLTHPIYVRLAALGPPADIVRGIEAERQAGMQSIGPAEFTYSWMMVPSFFGLKVVPLEHVVWVFRYVQSINFIPVMNSLRILDRNGKAYPLYISASQVTRITDYIVQNRPWIVSGYGADLLNRYSKDRNGFVAEVDARRQLYTRGSSVPAGTPLNPVNHVINPVYPNQPPAQRP